MKYMLTATYIQFIEINDDEDLDSALDLEFNDLPDKVGAYKEWEISSADWERVTSW